MGNCINMKDHVEQSDWARRQLTVQINTLVGFLHYDRYMSDEATAIRLLERAIDNVDARMGAERTLKRLRKHVKKLQIRLRNEKVEL